MIFIARHQGGTALWALSQFQFMAVGKKSKCNTPTGAVFLIFSENVKTRFFFLFWGLFFFYRLKTNTTFFPARMAWSYFKWENVKTAKQKGKKKTTIERLSKHIV